MPQHFAKIQQDGYVERIVQDCMGQKIAQAERFALGLSHYVFDVVTGDGGTCVIRIARPARKAELERGLYWQARLEALGVPLPRLYHWGEIEGYAFAVYQRLPGADLEEVYPTLSTGARERIAHSVAGIQRKIQALDDPGLVDALSWPDRLRLILKRSEIEILDGGLFDRRNVSLARERLDMYQDYMESVKPRAFLYDASVRNVIINHERVSGIIDVDDVWFPKGHWDGVATHSWW
jgi:Ser/Thr protein kinase RdoA (MazF antagonist)